MKKFLVLVLIIILGLTGCGNKDWIDTDNTFTKAIIELPGGEVKEIKLKSWSDYDGEQIKLVDKETGSIYIVNSVNCVLIDK